MGYNLPNISNIWEPWNDCGFPNALPQAAIPWQKQYVWKNELDDLISEILNHTMMFDNFNGEDNLI